MYNPCTCAHTYQVCPPGLHITLGIFTKIFELLEDECHTLDMELALYSREDAHFTFSTYSEALQKLRMLQAELEQTQKTYDALQQMATYASLVIGEKDPVTMDFFRKNDISQATSKPCMMQH